MTMRHRAVEDYVFDAEAWWRPRDLAALPSLGGGSDPAVDAMDELLAGFCEPGDLLITRRPMAAALRDGLGDAFAFDTVAGSLGHGGQPSTISRWVILGLGRWSGMCWRISGSCRRFVAPGSCRMRCCRRPGRLAEQLLPAPNIVAQVNSKSWSNELVQRLGLPGAGRVVRSTDELVDAVTALDFRALVKDPYGVSGRALLEVPSPGVLKAIERVLRKQVDRGLRVELIVQEKYRKLHDFSGHLMINPDGTWEFLGIQQMTNRGFRHFGSSPAEPSLIDHGWYAETLAEVVPALTDAGYSGPVGVDSMLLEDGAVIPVLEINARQSLGLLAVHLDRRASEYGLSGHLWQLELNVAPGNTIDTVIAAFQGIAYRGGSIPGVTVLNGSTLAAPGGRVYVAIFCPVGEIHRWQQRLLAEITTAGLTPRGMTDAA